MDPPLLGVQVGLGVGMGDGDGGCGWGREEVGWEVLVSSGCVPKYCGHVFLPEWEAEVQGLGAG